MKGRIRRCVAVLALATSLAVAPSPASAQNIESFHLLVTGVAELFASTCPIETAPAPESECVDTFVLFAQEGFPNERVRNRPWSVLVFETRLVFHDEASPVTILHERFGFLEDPTGSMDTVHLLRASVAAQVPMDDGSTYGIDLDWDMSGTHFNVSGNDGPIQEEGVPWGSHSVDDCLTQNWHAHQTWREGGSISGTLNGVDVSDLIVPSWEPFMGRGVFTIVISSHGDCD